MKVNFGLLGIALAQSGDYESSDERYDYDYNLGSSYTNTYSGNGYGQSYSFQSFGGKTGGNTSRHKAKKLSCWNSNHLRDMNWDNRFYDHVESPLAGGNDDFHHYHHQYGFENAYVGGGSPALAGYGDILDTDHTINPEDDDHSVMAVDPKKWGYQNWNPDAKFHYGHHIHEDDLSTNPNRPHHDQITGGGNTPAFNGVIDDWRYSLRHAGCLYEMADFFYGPTTFNKIRTLTYSYDDDTYAKDDITDTDVYKAKVHWIHVFNAHIKIDNSNGYCSETNPGALSDHKCLNQDRRHQFAVVMANPTYEGLGFLNFVATYIDNDGETNPHGIFDSTYDKAALYDNAGGWFLSDLGDTYAEEDDGSNNWNHECHDADCDTDDWAKGLAISSFPHNQLGKDFRFNIRTLHMMGDGLRRAKKRTVGTSTVSYSYFFYGIKQIVINFPHFVAKMNECWRQGVDCDVNNVDDSIVDQTSVEDISASPQNRNGDIADNNVNLRADLTKKEGENRGTCDGSNTGSNGTPLCAHWCRKSTANTHSLCGNTLTINGILNTYDELHLRQFGTIQEIWVQLMYAYATYTTVNSVSGGFESPFPNLFFNAPEVHSITASCPSDDYGKCSGYTRSENVPYAGSNEDDDRWVLDADGLGGARGESFWPDDFDASRR